MAVPKKKKKQYPILSFMAPADLSEAEVHPLRRRLEEIAMVTGYIAARGPLAGYGHVGKFLAGIARGEVIPIRLTPEERGKLLEALRQLNHRDHSGIFQKLIGYLTTYEEILLTPVGD